MTSQFHADFFGDDPEQQRARPTHVQTPDAADSSRYAQSALSRELEALTHAAEGTRNDQLNTAGFNLGQLVASGHLSYDNVYRSLFMVAVAIGLSEEETRNTLRSSLTAASQFPRQVAELEAAPELVIIGNVESDEPANDEPATDIGEQYRVVNWHDLWAEDAQEDFIVDPLVPARRLVAFYSPPKMGKSLLMLDLAQCVARGVPFLGSKTERADADGLDRGRTVLYVDHENDLLGDIRPRLQAMGVQPDQLDRLKYLSFPSMPFLDSAMGGLVLLAVARFYEAELVVIDTISRAVGGEENANDTWLGFYRNTGKLLKAAGIACVRLDHTGKDETKGMRGGSAKYGDVDAAWSMTRDAGRLGLDLFKLECTANRLPLTTKELMVERQIEPLRHVLNANAVRDALRAEQERYVFALSSIGFPVVPRATNKDGVPSALTRCREAFPAQKFYDKPMRDALDEYRDRAAFTWSPTTD